MNEILPGDICPKSGTWTPSGNPNFYPVAYMERVMKRHINAGEVMPSTPHGETSWILQTCDSKPLINCTGLNPSEIIEKLHQKSY